MQLKSFFSDALKLGLVWMISLSLHISLLISYSQIEGKRGSGSWMRLSFFSDWKSTSTQLPKLARVPFCLVAPASTPPPGSYKDVPHWLKTQPVKETKPEVRLIREDTKHIWDTRIPESCLEDTACVCVCVVVYVETGLIFVILKRTADYGTLKSPWGPRGTQRKEENPVCSPSHRTDPAGPSTGWDGRRILFHSSDPLGPKMIL